MGLSRTVSEIDGNFSRKLQNFPTPLYFAPQLKGFPLELCTGVGSQKTRIMGLPHQEWSVTIPSAIWIQCTSMTDGQTDTGWQQRLCLCIALRGNKSYLISVFTLERLLTVHLFRSRTKATPLCYQIFLFRQCQKYSFSFLNHQATVL